MEIRFIKENELDQLIELCALHAAYEKAVYSKKGKLEQLRASLFKSTPDLYCLIVVEDEKLLGYSTYMLQYSTWDASYYIYLDCIFIIEEARGQRIGEQLMSCVMEKTHQLGANLVQWQTPDFNHDAIRFYKRIGANSKSKERFFWMK